MANPSFKSEHKEIVTFIEDCIKRGMTNRMGVYPGSNSDLESCIREILNRCDVTRLMDHRETWELDK